MPTDHQVDDPTISRRHIDSIRPYWRNPRTIPDHAVQHVAESISSYGYLQPIVIDADGVIIAGHTRYAALRQLGTQQVPVIIADLPPAEAKRYRILDNRTGEDSKWDQDLLIQELREQPDELIADYFPNLDAAIKDLQVQPVTDDEIHQAVADVHDVGEARKHELVLVTCPGCGMQFEIRADSIQPAAPPAQGGEGPPSQG